MDSSNNSNRISLVGNSSSRTVEDSSSVGTTSLTSPTVLESTTTSLALEVGCNPIHSATLKCTTRDGSKSLPINLVTISTRGDTEEAIMDGDDNHDAHIKELN